MKIDHIGYLSKDIYASIDAFKTLGYTQVTEIFRDDIENSDGSKRNVFLCFLDNGGTRIELVSPIDESSDVYDRLKRHGEGPYHICYQVRDLESAIANLKRDRWLVLKPPVPAIAFDGARVAFLVKTGVGLIELVETIVGGTL